jgi:CspA family cold shock protein
MWFESSQLIRIVSHDPGVPWPPRYRQADPTPRNCETTSRRQPRRGGSRQQDRKEEVGMASGTVKWFNATKGYGFIQPDDGSKDAFVHISAVERAGLSGLREGQKVEFDLVPGRNGKTSAENLVVGD